MLSLGVSSEWASHWTSPQRGARPPVQSPGVWRGWNLEPASCGSPRVLQVGAQELGGPRLGHRPAGPAPKLW